MFLAGQMNNLRSRGRISSADKISNSMVVATVAASQQVPSEKRELARKYQTAKYEPMQTTSSKLRQINRSSILLISVILLASQQQLSHGQQTETSDQNPSPSSQSSSAASSCFGGIQTFEKISMSTFENPPTSVGGGSGQSSAGSSFGSGILIQQDDQALTSECVNLCRSQSNCLSFVIDYNKFECKSYATTQQELQQELDANFNQQQHAARSINIATANGTDQQPPTISGGYLTSASSNINVQHLLPSPSSNYFEKICLDGIANRNQFNDVCGQGRLWIIERVVDAFLDGYVEKEVTNVNNKDECSKLCLFESQFVCRSADYDQAARLCRLSKEDRRTQPQAMRQASGSRRQYLENQCATPGPSSCVYETRKNLGIISMDALKFAQTVQDCQMKCNQEQTFNCRSYSFHQQRCFLSGDDSTSLNSNLVKLPAKQGWQFGEKKCLIELCTKGVFTYEKITGHTLRSALSSPIDLMMQSGSSPGLSLMMGGANNLDDLERLQHESSQTRLSQLLPVFHPRAGNSSGAANMVSTMMMVAANRQSLDPDPMYVESTSSRQQRSTTGGNSNLAIMNHCRHSCDLGYLNCPAFTIDYKNNRCQRLDRNSQGRHHELVAREGVSYYEKICLRVPEIMSMCQDKYWIFERVLGYELAPRLYEKTLKFIQSRRDCEEYCLEEKQFQCRSALYNDETSDCKLSRYDRRLAQQEGAYNRNSNPRISYLENQCVRDHGSLVVESGSEKSLQCYYEQARDEPALPTYTEHIEMVPASPLETEQASRSSISNNTRYGVSYCEQLCNDNARFECHSFGYYPSVAQCFLSGDDSISAGDAASTYRTGFSYYEKKCRLAVNSTAPRPPQQQQDPDTTPAAGGDPYAPIAPTRRPANEQPTTETDPHYPSVPPKSGQPNAITLRPSGANEAAANQYKCGQAHSFVYQRIPGFEPIGGYLTLLVRNNNQPGIVNECAELCKSAFECRAFVVDYNNNQCFAMLENSSVGLLSLRQMIGKDYFEGFCVADHVLLPPSHATPKSCAQQTWLMDKIVDQAVIGVQPSRVLANSDRVQCRLACLEERLFYCKSAMFESQTKDCKLYSIDRESNAQMRLIFTKGVDFYENQCQINSNTCPYDAIERDMTIVTVTKSLQAKSTFDCEHACNSEINFNCRSYTYLDKYPSLPNLCLLSSDSRSTSQKGSVRDHPRTLYAERNCYFRRPRIPGDVSLAPPLDPYAPAPNQMDSRGLEHHTTMVQVDPYAAAPAIMPVDLTGHEQQDSAIPGGQQCRQHQFTFERTFGYDFRLAPKERAPIAPTIGIAIACQQECLRRGDRCQSFVVDYALPFQSCFLIEAQVGANKKLLIKSANSAYFEKICLPRPGLLAGPPPPSAAAAAQYDGGPADMQHMDMAPGYSQEPWSPQPPKIAQTLPYYLQQQQLVDTYPSRACAKLWSFERFVNHNFTAPADKVIAESVFTRAQCESHCLNEASFSCRAATYDYNAKLCRLFKNTRRTLMSQFSDLDPGVNNNNNNSSDESQQPRAGRQLASAEPSNAQDINIDYMENTCAPEPSSCQYRQLYDLFSPYIDKIQHAVSLSDCQRQCDLERLFGCKSINYDPATRKCMLINEDFISLNRGQAQPHQGLLPKRNSIYSEKGNCELISVQCNSQEMLVSINFDSPFRGRIMAKGNPEQCFMVGDGQTSLQFPIVFGPKCNSRQEGENTFVNEIVIQQHPVIMTDSDKTVRVMCAFEAPEQTITLKNPSSRDQNKTGIDVVGQQGESSRTRHDKQHQRFNSVVSNKAPPPSVMLRILDQGGRDASMINLGDDLTLKIQMPSDNQGQSSALGIFARNLAARSSNGESLMLIDNDGCPVDHNVFPALEVDPKDGRSLYSTFRAFRFPSSGLVNFEVQIRFCPERCQPVDCPARGSPSTRMKSFGRRRKRQTEEQEFALSDQSGRAPILQSVSTSIELPGTVMKPGKAFQFVRELLSLTPQPPQDSISTTSSSPVPADEREESATESSDQEAATDNADATRPEEQAPSRPLEKNILMHVDERTIPAQVPATNQLMQAWHPAHSQQAPPYGRIPFLDQAAAAVDQQQQQQDTSIGNVEASDQTFAGAAETASEPSVARVEDAKQAEPNMRSTASTGFKVSPPDASSGSSDKDVPLRFSILVGEGGQTAVGPPSSSPSAAVQSWTPSGGAAQPVLVMNSTNLDIDHIVIPGKDGQLDGQQHAGGAAAADSNHNSLSTESSNQAGETPFGLPSDLNRITSSAGGKRASYEQTFDAQPSNSVATEETIENSDNVLSPPDEHIGHSASRHRHKQQAPEVAAASRDCQVDSGQRRLWTIIWTGAFVIALNICLVIVSLVLYFKKVHLRQNHSIIHATTSLDGTATTDRSHRGHLSSGSRRSRWPSVLLKSKNDLGSTSLNAHEHFFCKLNSKPTTSTTNLGVGNNNSNDFNWPNLSSSSSHSTISSMASPLPISSVRIHHQSSGMRPTYKYPFDTQASIRNNFNPGFRGILDEDTFTTHKNVVGNDNIVVPQQDDDDDDMQSAT